MSAVMPRTEPSPKKRAFSAGGILPINRGSMKLPGRTPENISEPKPPCVRERISDLNLQGVSRFCNKSYSILRRVFWACLWLLFLTAWCYHCTTCVKRFLYYPTTVDVKYIETATIMPPCVTICPSDDQWKNPAVWPSLLSQYGSNLSYQNAYELLSRTNMTINELWNISRVLMPNESFGMSQMNEGSVLNGYLTSENSMERQEIFTISGVCVTYKPKLELECIGVQSGLAIRDGSKWTEANSSDPKTYAVIFHTEQEIPLLHYFGPLLIGSSLGYGTSTIAAIRVQEISHIDLWNNRCDSTENYNKCLLRCFETFLMTKARNINPCRLPFMILENSTDLRQCKTPEDFLSMFTATESAIRGFRKETCKCRRACQSRLYCEDYYNKNKIDEMFALFLVVPRCTSALVEEQMSYDFSAFVADMGGALGLLLGLSMLNVVEIFEIFFLNLCLPRMKR